MAKTSMLRGEMARINELAPVIGDETALVCASVLANSSRWTAKGELQLGDTVAILGPGPQGIGCALAASLRGATAALVSLERDTARLESAAGLGDVPG